MISVSIRKLSSSRSSISSLKTFLTATAIPFHSPLYTTPKPPWPIFSRIVNSLHLTSVLAEVVGCQQPTTNNQQPTTNNQQPTTNNQQPTTNNQQPTTNGINQSANQQASANL
jgi:hypothetical protein